MTDKNNLKKCDSKYWNLESFLKGLAPQKEKKSRKSGNRNYWHLDLYGFSAEKHHKKINFYSGRN